MWFIGFWQSKRQSFIDYGIEYPTLVYWVSYISGCENYDFLPHRIFKYILNITTENTRDFIKGLSLGFVNVIDFLLIHLD